jgi:hypothetical protein
MQPPTNTGEESTPNSSDQRLQAVEGPSAQTLPARWLTLLAAAAAGMIWISHEHGRQSDARLLLRPLINTSWW